MSVATGPWSRRAVVALAAGSLLLTAACSGRSDDSSSSGSGSSSDQPIVVGMSFPLSGPLAGAAAVADGASAYFQHVNADGGINGRKIDYQLLDDGYDPARQADNARQLISEDSAGVVLTFGGISSATAPYLNAQKVAQVAFGTQAALSDTDATPYTRGWFPDGSWEGQVVGQHIAEAAPGATVGVLGINNDLTTSQVEGLTAAGVTPAKVLTVAPGVVDLTSQLNELRGAGVDTLFLAVVGPAQSATLRTMADIGYKPQVYLYSAASDFATSIGPAGLPNVTGALTAQYFKDPADPRWADDEGVQAFRSDIAEYGDAKNADSYLAIEGYGAAAAIVATLEESGGEGGEAFTEAWDGIDGEDNPALLPDMQLSAGPGSRLVHQYRVLQFDGTSWQDAGDVVDAAGLTQG
ncbi:ABC transporter substrate-binding protein [Modestobacter altitudinis]|uniref:ABC transporter substrate-binding protein n=1 Tax=Modestobacter altitudinis TaxID=2213158 RepID=UPI00110D1A4D|nr:ABC transporter substrate-binding protein [Modestobacter altitudinis]